MKATRPKVIDVSVEDWTATFYLSNRLIIEFYSSWDAMGRVRIYLPSNAANSDALVIFEAFPCNNRIQVMSDDLTQEKIWELYKTCMDFLLSEIRWSFFFFWRKRYDRYLILVALDIVKAGLVDFSLLAKGKWDWYIEE